MDNENRLRKHLSPMGAWALAIGTSVGWGSLAVTSNTYLVQAGPAGTILGLLAGAAVMLIISRNYEYLMRCYPDSGGAYSYAREVFGYDQGFIVGWFLTIVYFAMLWANATSLPLFVRIFFGKVLQVGRMYRLFGYDVYLGEALLSVAAIVLIGILCARCRKLTYVFMIIIALLFTVGILVCTIAAARGGFKTASPAFVPDSNALGQILKIAVISPWAFIGFESISHSVEEFGFEQSRIRRVLTVAVISTVVVYILVTLLSVSAYPPEYSSWLEYIRDLNNLSGIKALPAFYAANHYMGAAGINILMLSLLALVFTSIIGNITALSRLFYALALESVVPKRFSKINDEGLPSMAVLLVVAISFIAPFLGRTAIGWIVDVTTIGAVFIYGFVSAATAALAKDMGDKKEMILGRTGLLIMVLLGVYFLAPNLIMRSSMATETYFLFIVWTVLGFLYFRAILQMDKTRRFGNSIIVWIVLLAIVLLISLIWMRQSMIESNDTMLTNIRAYYSQEGSVDEQRNRDETYIEEQMDQQNEADTRTMLMALGMFGFALLIMLTNHSYMTKRSKENEMLANRDSMTGAMSKHAYSIKESELNSNVENGIARDFSVVVCDVNGLKKINDTYGHKAGDEYIKNAYALISDIFRNSVVYRVGGDEFVLILTGRDHTIRRELMTALHDHSLERITAGGAVVSGGISDYLPGEDRAVHDVFERADALMYEEKMRLKELGAVTRDDESDEQQNRLMSELEEKDAIIKVRRHVLIVEDELVNQMLLANVLEDMYEIMYASDGIEAMEKINGNKDDLALVLLDLQMPQMGGMEVLARMQEDKEIKNIPVIVLTADQNAEVECLKIGAMDFITKPYPMPEIIRARVNKCIELSENRDIIHSTERDSLTKLFNVDYFMRYVKMYDQHYWDMLMDAVVLDVTHFHLINERYGKFYGDSVLRRVGEKLRGVAREIGGVGCRRGADTFLIYCPHRDDYEEILDKVSAGVSGDESSSNRVRLRIGVYSEVDKNLDIELRFDRAKIAADSVKSGFKKAVGVYDAKMSEMALYKERLLEDFPHSIEEGRFSVYLQPKYDIRPEKPILASAEALVRWNHQELGMISPAVFIPLLEDNGLILELDRFVWRATAAVIRSWKDRFGFSVPVSVNVSRIDMLNPDLKGIFKEILETYSLSTNDIILEITESAYTGDSEQVISTARDLRGMGMGFRIEMDDFGTGYSSLGMLNHLPIDALKLDMTFVRNAFGETRDVRMIELIIDIADYLGVPVVAEGVETEEQYLTLKAMGCDLVQGYYFSKPVPEAEFDRFLKERGDQSIEVTPSVRKTYMSSISGALSGSFESFFYVDTLTDYYLEFSSPEGGDLEIRPGGEDFFEMAQKRLLEGVCEEDRAALSAALRKENLVGGLGKETAEVAVFRKAAGGKMRTYSLEMLRTRSRDDSHIVIGVREKR